MLVMNREAKQTTLDIDILAHSRINSTRGECNKSAPIVSHAIVTSRKTEEKWKLFPKRRQPSTENDVDDDEDDETTVT